jgi:hypothetical protein
MELCGFSPIMSGQSAVPMTRAKGIQKRVRPILHGLRRTIGPPDYKALVDRVDLLERGVAALLRDQYEEVAATPDQRVVMRRKEFKIQSQNGEDGLLLYIFSKIGTTNHRLVEIGFGNGRECNAANLILNFGWNGLMVDCVADQVESARNFYYKERGVETERLKLAERMVNAENVNSLIQENGIEGPIDLLSVDVDGNDYWVWKALDVIDPQVVVIEFNASLGPEKKLVVEYDPEFIARNNHPRGWYHGASLAALVDLGAGRGYTHIGCDSMGVNAFFVKNELAGDHFKPLSSTESYYPHRRRMKYASPSEQFDAIKGFKYFSP